MVGRQTGRRKGRQEERDVVEGRERRRNVVRRRGKEKKGGMKTQRRKISRTKLNFVSRYVDGILLQTAAVNRLYS
jgi:hypothetical protein